MGHDDVVHILVAPDRFGPGLTALQTADAMAAGWRVGAPHDAVVRLPLSDGGPGFGEAVRAACGGALVPVTVAGPSGAATPVPVTVVEGPAGPTAYLEAALAVGPHLLPATGGADPALTSSSGVGQALRAVLEHGIRRVVVAVGGAASHDAGAGVLAGLGLASAALGRGGAGLSGLTRADLDGLEQLRRELAGVDLVGAVDTDLQLLGLHGASAGLAGTVGSDRSQELERALSAFAHLVGEVVAGDAVRRDLLAPTGDGREHTRRLAQLPGAGAGGGLGFVLAALGGRLRPGAQVAADAVGLDRHVDAADLVLTGGGELAGPALHDGVVATVAAQALRRAVPAIAVAGQVHVGRREWGAAGLSGVYAVAERPGQVPPTAGDAAAAALQDRVARVARTWSR